MSFYDVIKIMSPKIRHQNDIIKIFHFQAPPLAKLWLRSCLVIILLTNWQSSIFRTLGIFSILHLQLRLSSILIAKTPPYQMQRVVLMPPILNRHLQSISP